VYADPLTVTNTTVLRAAVVDPQSLKLNIRTVTWLFLEDILRQSADAPANWPTNKEVNAQAMEYGMRQAIVTSDPDRLRNGMTNAIPSISLVTDLTNLFSAASGIYVNPSNDGLAWERPVSVEMIDPVRGSNYEFRIDAGLRIRGAASRTTGNAKHSFRLFFRSDYGESKLKFKLFDDEGADSFEKVDLRTSQNYSWAKEDSTQETFIRETFSRDTQRDLGMPYTRSRYYHLYINGQYWGLYQTQERGDADFAETYFGDDANDWDCIKTSSPGYTTTAADGSFDAFYAPHDIAINEGFAGTYSNNYWRVRGMNSDGTANADYPVSRGKTPIIRTRPGPKARAPWALREVRPPTPSPPSHTATPMAFPARRSSPPISDARSRSTTRPASPICHSPCSATTARIGAPSRPRLCRSPVFLSITRRCAFPNSSTRRRRPMATAPTRTTTSPGSNSATPAPTTSTSPT